MRYWAYLAGKVLVAAAPLYPLFLFLQKHYLDVPGDGWPRLHNLSHELAGYLLLLGWFLLCAGALYFIVWDQRRRCRVCLHLLRMPIETGSRSFMLQLGQPRIESICPYGHGTLREDESITGRGAEEWTPHSDDIWDELCAPGKDNGQEP